ncbi:hypothetical protein HNR61_005627 [Actinomadura namibiensis]|uniref:Uncharacterized protein n=1 Tax=Actinomadura namibiensis TaxID=182080 RepID=A0A7W3LTE7_ACTNM|nr:hypothetical protein [Actinomadura namibiensis]
MRALIAGADAVLFCTLAEERGGPRSRTSKSERQQPLDHGTARAHLCHS